MARSNWDRMLIRSMATGSYVVLLTAGIWHMHSLRVIPELDLPSFRFNQPQKVVFATDAVSDGSFCSSRSFPMNSTISSVQQKGTKNICC